METNVDILIQTTSDTSGVDKYETSIKKADKATEELGKSQEKQEKSNTSLSNSFKGTAGKITAMITVIAGVTAAVAKSIGVYKDFIISEQKLNQALGARNKTMGLSNEQHKESTLLAKEQLSIIQKQLSLTDQQIDQSAVWFSRVGASNDQLERFITLASDMAYSTGEDLNDTSKDLSESFHDLGGAMESSRQRGVGFTKAEEEMLARMQETNNIVEGQEYLLSKLEDKFGGTTEKMNNGFIKAQKDAQIEMQEFMAVLGNVSAAVSIPALEGTTAVFNEIKDIFSGPEMKEMSVSLAGILGFFKQLLAINYATWIKPLIDGFLNLGVGVAKTTNIAVDFFAKLMGLSAPAIIALEGIGKAVVGLTSGFTKMAEAFEKAKKFDWDGVKKSVGEATTAISKGFDAAGKDILKAFDVKTVQKKAQEITSAFETSIKDAREKAAAELERNSVIPDIVVDEAGNQGTKAGGLFSEKFNSAINEAMPAVNSSLQGTFDLINSFGSIMGDGLQQSLEPFQQELDKVNSKYEELFETIEEKRQALEEQDQEIADAQQERDNTALEQELARLEGKTGAYLSAEELKKKQELKDLKETQEAEKKKAKEQEKLDKEQAALEKQLAEEQSNIKFAQDTADRQNQKATFEAGKQQNLFSSSMAMVEAPIKASLAILQGGVQGGPVGAGIMAGIAAGAVASVISSAVQLANTAQQTFDVPAPVKAFWTGGTVPLTEGSQFRIGGRYGAEELATVSNGNLLIENSLQTAEKDRTSDSRASINIQHMVVQSNDPQSFSDELINKMREEQYL